MLGRKTIKSPRTVVGLIVNVAGLACLISQVI